MAYARAASLGMAAACLAVAPRLLQAQESGGAGRPVPGRASEVDVVAGPDYAAGGLRRALFGGRYRALWTAPLHVPVLDLDTLAGGTHAVSQGGGMQTLSLRLENAEGRSFKFRSLDKDPTINLPPALRRTFLADIVQDQTHAMHPGGAMAAPPVLAALGVAHVAPELVVLSDGPALGEFRETFAGRLGMLEEHPDDGAPKADRFGGFARIEGTEKLMKLVNERSGEQVDPLAFLTARMADFLLGDFDRHGGQWRWGTADTSGSRTWIPIPGDRDLVFVSYDGFFLGFARLIAPQLVVFDGKYRLNGLTQNGHNLDRRILAGLEREAWDSVASSAQDRVTDSVLADALARMPEPFRELREVDLLQVLQTRRAGLRDAALEYYERLARVVEVHGTDARDIATVTRLADGGVQLELRAGDAPGPTARPYFSRRFVARETREVRIYLHGGADSASVEGRARAGAAGAVQVRIIGGAGNNTLVDRTSGNGVRLYDRGPTGDVLYGPDSLMDWRIDRRPWRSRGDGRSLAPGRDRGWFVTPSGGLSVAPDAGIVLRAGAALQSFGFRRDPYDTQLGLDLVYATGADAARLTFSGTHYAEGSSRFVRGSAAISSLDRLHFFGLGNQTARPATPAQTDLDHRRFSLALELGAGEPGHQLAAGIVAQLDETRGPLIASATPTPLRGTRDFAQLGFRVRGLLDRRNSPWAPDRGFRLSGSATLHPAVLDATGAFGLLEAEAAVYRRVPGPLPAVLALRAGGRRAWGDYPYFDAVYLGAGSGLRGYDVDRFAGDAALYGNLDLRIPVVRIATPLPGTFGVTGSADAGRVYLDGETSKRWHTALGGGAWFDFMSSGNLLSITLLRGAERTAAYVGGGFTF